MQAQQQQQQQQQLMHPNMRQMGMGTQTLGRHHSPNHMRQNSGELLMKASIESKCYMFMNSLTACTDHSHPHPHVQPQPPNIYQTQQQLQAAQYAHYKQHNPNASFTDSLPPPPLITSVTSAHPPQTISGNPNYTQQQQIYIQQQQIYQQQQYQTLRRKQAQAQAMAQTQGQMAQMNPTYQANPNQQQQQQLVNQPLGNQQMNPTQSVQMTQMSQMPIQQQQQQQYIVTTSNYTPAPPSATMAVVTANNSIYVQSTTIPAQNNSAMENPIFERDKQIYKCSTLGRYGAKHNEMRQNLVPAVIPTVPIPKFNGQPQMAAPAPTAPVQMATNNASNQRPSIQSCPLPDIPSVQTFKNDSLGSNEIPVNR